MIVSSIYLNEEFWNNHSVVGGCTLFSTNGEV